MKRIVMEVIPHADQRYNTLGDYWEDPDGTLQFRVSDLGDWRYNFSILLHEFVEFAVLKHRGVPEPAVLAFDLAVSGNSPYADDPGFDPKAPYHWEHVLADTLERLLSIFLEFEVADQWEVGLGLPAWRAKP